MNTPPSTEPDCEWHEDIDGVWETECKNYFCIDEGGTPTEHQFKFCCYCGKRLHDYRYVEEEDADE